MAKRKIDICETDLCKDYTENKYSLASLCQKYHIGKLKIKEILSKNNIRLNAVGGQNKESVRVVKENWGIERYPAHENKQYIVYDENTDFETTDIRNKSGVITTYLRKQYDISTPSLFYRRKFYVHNNYYWWEQWLSVKEVEKSAVKKCPYCDWETIDVENKSGAFETHLLKAHNINKLGYIKSHPEDKSYFGTKNKQNMLQMEENADKFVVCKVCGKRLSRIDSHHLSTHGMSKTEYMNKFGINGLVSKEYHEKQSILTTENNKKAKIHKQSSAEKELIAFIEQNGVICRPNRSVLNGLEIDIYIPRLNIGIEYNGLQWHTEKYGKNKHYHLDKTVECAKKGISLVQIFEDEYVLKKDIVLSKLKHMLKCDNNPKIYGRKCIIGDIDKKTCRNFLERHHLQGFANSTRYIGAFFSGELVAVMSFTDCGGGKWNLSRYAGSIYYRCVGIAGKLLKYFIKNTENVTEIKTFADRRWLLSTENNLYTKLGFKLDKILPPDYTYYNSSVDRLRRFHKFLFRKKILNRKYGLPLTMTEKEMAKSLKFDRIWNCGLIRYVLMPN